MGQYRSSPLNDVEVEEAEVGNLHYVGGSMQGWRLTMEDAHFALHEPRQDVVMFGVFDGHGGDEVAKFCAAHLGQEVIRDPAFQNGDFKAALTNAFLKMDEMIRDPAFAEELQSLSSAEQEKKKEREKKPKRSSTARPSATEAVQGSESDRPAKKEAIRILEGLSKLRVSQSIAQEENKPYVCGAGCTATVALIHKKRKIYVANAGDSRAVLSRKGKPVVLSNDHKPDRKTERKRIEAAGGIVTDGRVNGVISVSRSIGDLAFKKNAKLKPGSQLISAMPEISEMELKQNGDDEFLVLVCDGVTDVKTNEQLILFLKSELGKGPASNAVRRLFADCLSDSPTKSEGIGADNMTCVLVTL